MESTPHYSLQEETFPSQTLSLAPLEDFLPSSADWCICSQHNLLLSKLIPKTSNTSQNRTPKPHQANGKRNKGHKDWQEEDKTLNVSTYHFLTENPRSSTDKDRFNKLLTHRSTYKYGHFTVH